MEIFSQKTRKLIATGELDANTQIKMVSDRVFFLLQIPDRLRTPENAVALLLLIFPHELIRVADGTLDRLFENAISPYLSQTYV